jgi:hypothetical protein
MPPELTRADYIVSANVVRIGAGLPAGGPRCEARRRLADRSGVRADRYSRHELGSCLSMLTARTSRASGAGAQHVSPWFADVVWRGLSTRHVREGLEGHIELETLRRLWRPISPWAHLEQVASQQRFPRTLLVYARYDLTLPVDLSDGI